MEEGALNVTTMLAGDLCENARVDRFGAESALAWVRAHAQ
jgi:hypothetical protein